MKIPTDIEVIVTIRCIAVGRGIGIFVGNRPKRLRVSIITILDKTAPTIGTHATLKAGLYDYVSFVFFHCV